MHGRDRRGRYEGGRAEGGEQTRQAVLVLDEGWLIDCSSDRLASGRGCRTLKLIVEFNREAVAIEVDTALPASRVVRVLEQVKTWRPQPMSIHVNNKPKIFAEALDEWYQEHEIHLNFIPSRKPQKNGYVERFYRSFREEIPDCYLLNSPDEIRDIA